MHHRRTRDALGTPLPGVSVIATRDGQVVFATSTDLSGAYRLRLSAGEFVVSAELAAFARFERPVVVTPESCQASLDIELVLASRARATAPAASGPVIDAPTSLRRPNRLGGDPAQPGQPRFSQLQVVQANGAGAAESASASPDDADPATRLLPPGFSTDAATSVVAVTGDAVISIADSCAIDWRHWGAASSTQPACCRPRGSVGASVDPVVLPALAVHSQGKAVSPVALGLHRAALVDLALAEAESFLGAVVEMRSKAPRTTPSAVPRSTRHRIHSA